MLLGSKREAAGPARWEWAVYQCSDGNTPFRRILQQGLTGTGATKLKVYTLYGTSACHLCEQAQELLQWARSQGVVFEYRTVDISLSDDLFERYGLLIPVLRSEEGGELTWPFEPSILLAFLGGP